MTSNPALAAATPKADRKTEDMGCLELAVMGLFDGLERKKKDIEGVVTEVLEAEGEEGEGEDDNDDSEDSGNHHAAAKAEDEGDGDDDGNGRQKKTVTRTTTFTYSVSLQFLEVYGEEVRDLLGPTPGKVRGDTTRHQDSTARIR